MTDSPDALALRQRLMRDGLRLRDAAPGPMDVFGGWLQQARDAGLRLPHAMTLCTVDGGRPAARMLLLAAHDARGFVFCTDAESPKARQISETPWAALVFHWAALERQVRVEGRVAPAEDQAAEVSFARRAWGARMAAWVGPAQSQPVPDRASLERDLLALIENDEGQADARPPGYVAYRLVPDRVEFWQGRDDWLHDRLRYARAGDGGWRTERLAP